MNKNVSATTQYMERFLEVPGTSRFILWVILFNAAILGLETSVSLMHRFGSVIAFLD
jgi:voltage-gated sodium channel